MKVSCTDFDLHHDKMFNFAPLFVKQMEGVNMNIAQVKTHSKVTIQDVEVMVAMLAIVAIIVWELVF